MSFLSGPPNFHKIQSSPYQNMHPLWLVKVGYSNGSITLSILIHIVGHENQKCVSPLLLLAIILLLYMHILGSIHSTYMYLQSIPRIVRIGPLVGSRSRVQSWIQSWIGPVRSTGYSPGSDLPSPGM